MKIYFLRFDVNDLTQENGLWVTPAVDLYDNNQFTNYSTYKTSYGLGGELFTWAGLKKNSAPGATDFEYFTLDELQSQDTWTDFDTDTALVRSGRIIDLTAQVDIVSFTMNAENESAKLHLYSSKSSDETNYTTEWYSQGGGGVNEEVDAEDIERYVKFGFELDVAPASSVFEALVRVEVHDPVVAPLFRFTRAVMRNFPQWMDMHHLPEEGATPSVTEPNTVGAQFANAIMGEGLDESYRKLYYYRNQTNIYTVDLDQTFQAYRTTGIPDRIYSISADGVEPAVASTYEEFLLHPGEDIVYIDYNESTLYAAKEYTSLILNTEDATPQAYEQSVYTVFNFLDDLGMKVDLYRIDGESNENFQKRILDVYKNHPGAGIEDFKLALRRELDLWRTEGATPDSDYVGATPTVLEIEDILDDPSYFTAGGLPTRKFMDLIDELSHRFPATWGRFVWGDALWDVAGEDGIGYDVIPYQYDATPVSSPYKQPGVGDGDDLLLHRPDANTGPEDYTATLKVKGLEKTLVDEYTGIDVEFYTQPVGTYDVYDNPTTTIYLTVEVADDAATPNIYYDTIQMSSTSDYSGEMATPATTDQSWTFEQIISEVEAVTSAGLEFKDKATGDVYGTHATPVDPSGIIPLASITSIDIVQGRWDVDGQTYTDIEGSDIYKVWLSHDDTTYLDQSMATPTQLSLDNATATSERPTLVLESKQVAAPVATEWRGDRVDYEVVLNGIAPYTSAHSKEVDLKGILFDSYVTGRSIEIGLTLEEEAATPSGNYGGLTRNDRDEEIFIDSDLILVDSSNAWDVDGKMNLAEGTTSVTFTTLEAATPNAYPVENTNWEPFEATQLVPFSGIADIHGPWIDGAAPKEGNTNLNAHVYDSLERSDFGVANSTDYIIQRMEVSSDNERVITTLDSNAVASAIQEDEITSNPPANAIVEKLDESATPSAYYFEPFYLKARAKRGPTKDWKPQINTGFFYTRNEDYYLFAKPETLTTSGTELELNELARQGAPLVVEDGGTQLRQVAFFDEETLDFTFTNTETIVGDGTTTLLATYDDLYDIAVTDEDGGSVSVTATTAADNQITTSSATVDGHEYEVSYKLKNSFYVDHDNLDANNTPKSKVYFDQTPDVEYSVTYETSDLKETSFADVALNPAYSSQTEGFIFISDNEYDYAGIDFYMSPSSMLADGDSYSVLTFYAYDEYGNPKPEQGIDVSTTYGSFDEATPSQSTSVTTDIDGFAYTVLYSEAIPATPTDPVPTTGQITYTPAP